LTLGITGCQKSKNTITVDQLNDVNNEIIKYFSSNNVEYGNWSFNYVDEENNVVIVGLFDNSKEQQKLFKEKVVNSNLIKFIHGEPNEDHKKTSTLNSSNVSTSVLIRFDGILYGKSYFIIDYAGGSSQIGTIDKLIASEYVPKNNSETNTKEILNARIFDKTDNTIVLLYNNVYVLFGKIDE
jgi:hypothetical protein